MDIFQIVKVVLALLFVGATDVYAFQTVGALINDFRRKTKSFWLPGFTFIVLFFTASLFTSMALFDSISGIITWNMGALLVMCGLGAIVVPIYLYTHPRGWYKSDIVSILVVCVLLLFVVLGMYCVNEGRLMMLEAWSLEPFKSELPRLINHLLHPLTPSNPNLQ